VWVEILVCCPVELFGTSPVREIGFCGVGVQRSSYLTCVLCGGLRQSWPSCGTVGRTVGQSFLLDRIALPWDGFGAVSEEQWWVVLS
jgi:hypothetical protein